MLPSQAIEIKLIALVEAKRVIQIHNSCPWNDSVC